MPRLSEEAALSLAEEAFEYLMSLVGEDVHIRRSTNEFSITVLRGARPYRRKSLLHEPPPEMVGRFAEGLHHDIPLVDH